jgi:4-hydroxybenzoyl-CoA thioesterase
MGFRSRQAVRFAHVDAAGIVFYPRYFEMLNAAVEDFFAQAIGVDFAQIHLARRLGIPTVRLDVDFSAPSRLGDPLDFELEVARVGRSSLELEVHVLCAAELRFRATVVLVCIDLDRGVSVPWPEDMRPDALASG